jgi:hypothetical protein
VAAHAARLLAARWHWHCTPTRWYPVRVRDDARHSFITAV